MTSHFLTYEDHVIHYYKMGNGIKTKLAFHGFGLDGSSFKPIADSWSNVYTIYSFDLFYHGKSHWGEPNNKLTKQQWQKILQAFFQKEKINDFSLMAFSLGGKFALTTLELFPHKIKEITFIAPDGIKTQMWYNLATYPLIFQNYFKTMIVKPNRFFKILNLVKSVGLLDKSISKFAASQMNSARKRRRVYYSWVIFKDLKSDMKYIGKLVNTHNIEVTMFLGSYDKIITEEGMNKLLHKLKDYDLHTLECGHNNLIPHVAAFLRQIE